MYCRVNFNEHQSITSGVYWVQHWIEFCHFLVDCWLPLPLPLLPPPSPAATTAAMAAGILAATTTTTISTAFWLIVGCPCHCLCFHCCCLPPLLPLPAPLPLSAKAITTVAVATTTASTNVRAIFIAFAATSCPHLTAWQCQQRISALMPKPLFLGEEVEMSILVYFFLHVTSFRFVYLCICAFAYPGTNKITEGSKKLQMTLSKKMVYDVPLSMYLCVFVRANKITALPPFMHSFVLSVDKCTDSISTVCNCNPKSSMFC
jgi:hypothetical protein